jgi:hypothetical protein
MKNFFEYRGQAQRLIFDPVLNAFVSQHVSHPFLEYIHPAKSNVADESSNEPSSSESGEVKIAA